MRHSFWVGMEQAPIPHKSCAHTSNLDDPESVILESPASDIYGQSIRNRLIGNSEIPVMRQVASTLA